MKRSLSFACVIPLVVLSITVVMLSDQPSVSAADAPSAQLRVIQSDANGVVVELEISAYDVRTQTIGSATYVAISVPGLGSTNDPGKPRLPIKGALVGIPANAQVTLKIVADETRSDPLPHPPLPAPSVQGRFDPIQTLPREPVSSIAPDAATYSGNRFYPVDSARITSTGNWRSQRYAAIEIHPFQYNPATRQVTFHRRLRVEIAFSYPKGQTREAMGGSVNEGPFESTMQSMLLNYETAKGWRVRNAPAGLRTAKPSYTNGPWFKLGVNADGMYQVTCARLQAAGANLNLNPNTLKVYKQGTEVAIYQVWQNGDPCDDNHYVVFWGQSINTKYANTNVYWLTYGGVNGKRMTERDGSGSGSAPASFVYTLHLEQDRLYLSYIPMQEDANHWYWNGLFTNSPPFFCNPCDYTFQPDKMAAGTNSASLTINLMGYIYLDHGDHHTLVSINGNSIADITWAGQVPITRTISFPQTYLSEGINTIRLSEAQSNSVVLVNSFDVSYARTFVAVSDTLRFRQSAPGTWRFQIAGFTGSTIQTFDITDRSNTSRIISPTIQGGTSYTFQFADTLTTTLTTPRELIIPTPTPQPITPTPTREYITLTPPQYMRPTSITQDSVSDLKNTANGADYIIIAYGGFVPNVQALATFRQSQGLRVKVVDVQDVYDEFNDGVLDPQAIHDFLAYTYTNWQLPAPSLVLLVGDGTFDPKGNCVTPGWCSQITTPPNSTFIPPFLRMVDPYGNGENASDNRFVSFNESTGNMLPDMAIGRLPANSPAEVDAMVSKILNYEQKSPAGNWRTQVAFVADNPDDAGNFWLLSDQIAGDPQYMPAPLTADRIYYGQAPYTTAASAKSAIISSINDGRLIINYVGHSSITQWASESLFSVDDLAALANNKLPVILSLSCYAGFFQYPGIAGLGEASVRKSNGGALATWAATGAGYASFQSYLDNGFFEAVMKRGIRQLGPATIYAKTYLQLNIGQEFPNVVDSFTLFGDPASRLVDPVNPTNVVISSFTATWR